jgi:hypothetical protein
MWLHLAAEQGVQGASVNRDIIAGMMTPVQIARAQKLAAEWEQKK